MTSSRLRRLRVNSSRLRCPCVWPHVVLGALCHVASSRLRRPCVCLLFVLDAPACASCSSWTITIMLQLGPGSRNTNSVPGIFQEVFYLGSFHICPAQRYADNPGGWSSHKSSSYYRINWTDTNQRACRRLRMPTRASTRRWWPLKTTIMTRSKASTHSINLRGRRRIPNT